MTSGGSMTSKRSPIRVTLRRGRSKPFWLGHPWVFSGAIHKVVGDAEGAGGPCEVVDERGNVVGTGFYNPQGRIAVRLLQHRRTTDHPFSHRPVDELLATRIRAAAAWRSDLGFPNASTTAYRLVNAEGDGLSGLLVDVFGDVAVVQLAAKAMVARTETIRKQLVAAAGVKRVVFMVTSTASKLEGMPVLLRSVDAAGDEVEVEDVTVKENGVTHVVNLQRGQKTGFFCDQRDNRARFGGMSEGHDVLDLYAYSAGFSLSALTAGARSAIAVDTSKPALAAAQTSAAAGGFEGGLQTVKEDVVTYLKQLNAQNRMFTRIVCDPPKFASGRSHLADALKKYARVNTLAMSLLADDGLMLTCSCSRHVSAIDFERMLTEAGHRLRRSVQVLGSWGQPADHPTLSVAPEGRYLKAFLVRMGAR